MLGSGTTHQINRIYDAAWRSFFEMVEEADQEVSPPGYWENYVGGRDLRTYIRNDTYTINWGERSRLEIPIGSQLKDAYGFGRTERLRLFDREEPRRFQNKLQVEHSHRQVFSPVEDFQFAREVIKENPEYAELDYSDRFVG